MGIHLLIKLLVSFLLINTCTEVGASIVNVTLLHTAASNGAVCLDGSPPGVGFEKGYGTGADNWFVYLEGGGWCSSTQDCINRAEGRSYAPGGTLDRTTVNLAGALDDNQTFNPEFYNWNKAQVLYCDGASFMADIEEIDPTNNLTFRGARIFDAVMEDLLAKGMSYANNAILSGGSAGGLAAILHCDQFRALLPPTARVKCLSDSGFFIHARNLPGAQKIREHRFESVTRVHRLSERLPISCTSKLSPELAYQCLFPENLVDDVQTPLFLLESAFDLFQIKENYLRSVGRTSDWQNCTMNVTLCTADQIKLMQDFRNAFVETLLALHPCPSRGMFVHSCHRHGHILLPDGWTCSFVVGNNVLANKTIGEAFRDWYFDRDSFQVIDTLNDVPRECNKSILSPPEFDRECLTCRAN